MLRNFQVIESIPLGGDQLTEERIANAQIGRGDASTEMTRLQGVKPNFEDWHMKRTLYEVVY